MIRNHRIALAFACLVSSLAGTAAAQDRPLEHPPTRNERPRKPQRARPSLLDGADDARRARPRGPSAEAAKAATPRTALDALLAATEKTTAEEVPPGGPASRRDAPPAIDATPGSTEFATPPPAAASTAPGGISDGEAPSEEAIDRSLVGYGQWSDDPTFGRVWEPSEECVGRNFAPYATGGHWSLDGDRWRWNSTLPWGEPTFHYGNWVWRDGKGWAWVPGKTFAPAHVVWRLGPPGHDHVGWAPKPPPTASGATETSSAGLPFRFVAVRDLFRTDLEQHLVTDPALGRSLLQTTRAAATVTEANNLSPTLRELGLSPTRHGLQAAGASVETARARTTGAPAKPVGVARRVAPRPRGAEGYSCVPATDRPGTWRCGSP